MNTIKSDVQKYTGKELSKMYYQNGTEVTEFDNLDILKTQKVDKVIFEYSDMQRDEVNNIEILANASKIKFDYINRNQRLVALIISPIFWVTIAAMIIISMYYVEVGMIMAVIIGLVFPNTDKVYKKYGMDRFKIVGK